MSYEWYRRANAAIAQGSLTNSKRVESFIKGVTPTHVTHGEGPYLYGIDKKKYIDFCCANGTQIFGYAHPAINQAIKDQLSKGHLYSLGSTTEVEAAELVKNYVPFVKKVRFLKNGSDACEAATRIACAHTGRIKVLSSGYHGFNSQFVSLTKPAHGIPNQAHIEALTSLNQITNEIACVIIEPIETDHSQSRIEWLTQLREKCTQHGVLLIFDEIITGFRWPKYSFSAWSGIYPDIICLGKAAGGGLPLSIVGLADGIGDDIPWFVSATAAGELLSLAVMKKTYEMLHNKYSLDDLWRDGQHFLDQFNKLHPDLKIQGYPTRGVFVGDPKVKALFWQESHKAGILFGASWFYGFQHKPLRESVISACRDIMTKIKTNSVGFHGEMPSSPFAQQQREKA
jgi:glutamate-1-semialdehyde 2,1-aminomutase